MSKELKTGITISVIIIIFIWGFNFLKGKDVFSPSTRHFFVEYKNINGLNKASVVTIHGLQVGKVDKITFVEDPDKKGALLVELLIEDDYQFSKNSIAKIYPAGIMGGQNLAIIPTYDNDIAVSGDYLKGEIESGMFDVVGEKLNPIQSKLESVLVGADSLLIGANRVIDEESRKSLNRSILALEGTIYDVRKTLQSVNGLLTNSKADLSATLNNTKKITEDFAVFSSSLKDTDINTTIKKVETTLASVNNLMANLENGKGTLGKLMTDEKMYTNLTNASKEMEELLREMKLNPKRFVHFSLFGKKAKAFNEENNNENKSN